MRKYHAIIFFVSLNTISMLYTEISLAMRFGLQLGTITGIAFSQGPIQGTVTVGDSINTHVYYTKRKGKYIYYGIGTVVNFSNILNSKSEGGKKNINQREYTLVEDGYYLSKKKKDQENGDNEFSLFGSNKEDKNLFDDLKIRIPLGLRTYVSPVVIFGELGFYLIGSKGTDSVIGVRFYF